jgi:predicted kinase
MMQLDAPERDVPASPAVLRLPRAALLVVGGVPGAGKTTLLSRVDAPGSLVLDPEPIRARFRRRLGRVPYRLWRPLVHAEHFLRVLVALPGRSGLIVHDTGTRGWRRRLLVGLARRCGRTGHLLLLDVTAAAALEGQRRRRRTLRRSSFATHWRNWHRLRAELSGPAGPSAHPALVVPSGLGGSGDPDADPSGLRAEGWTSIRLLDRPAANRLQRIDIPHR